MCCSENTLSKRLNNYEEILTSMSQGKGLDDILKIAGQYLENPITLVGTSFNTLSAYIPEMDNPAFENDFLETIYYSASQKIMNQSIVDYILTSNRLKKAAESDQPHITRKETLTRKDIPIPCDFMDCIIRTNGIMIAMLSVGNILRDFTEDDLTYLEKLAGFIKLELERDSNFIFNTGLGDEILLHDLLNNRVKDDTDFSLRMKVLEKDVKDEFIIISTNLKYDININTVHLIRKELEQFFINSISSVYEDSLVFLITLNNTDSLDFLYNHRLQSYLQLNNIKLGISTRFNTPTKASFYHNEAQAAIELGRKIHADLSIYFYYDYSLYHGMDIVSQQIPISSLCHPTLYKMYTNGTKRDAELLETLYYWLLYERNTERITKKLNIHKSTLSYRIRSLKEILNTDLDDGTLTFRLRLSFELIYHTESFQNRGF